MNLSEALSIIEKQNVPSSQAHKEARNVYYGVTLHTKGARPYFKDLSSDKNAGIIYPPNYLGEEYQRLFDKFLLSKHPREDEVTRWWRYSQYREFTKSPFTRLTKTVKGLIYNDSKYVITLEDEDDNQYLKESNFEQNNNFISLFKNIFFQAMIDDPNGYIVVMPSKHRTEQTDKKLDVSFRYVRTIDVLHEKDEEDFIFTNPTKTEAFWINNKDIIRFVKVKEKWEIDDRGGYYAHQFNFIPAEKLQGIYNTIGFYESFISDAIPIANEYISSYSAEQLVDKEASHPYIQQAAMECPTCNATGETQEAVEVSEIYPHGFRKVTCGTCKGKKQISINPADRYEVPVDDMDKQMIKIINPDTTINSYHRNKNKELFNMILDGLDLLKVDASQSGLAKTIDRDNLYKFTSSISDRLFELKEFCIKCFIAYRRPDPVFTGYTIQKPTTFDIQTESDLLKEITELSGANMPIHIRKSMINEFVDKRYKGNDFVIKINRIYMALDKTFGYSLNDIKEAIEVGILTQDDVVLSRSTKEAVSELIENKTADYIKTTPLPELINEVRGMLN